MSYVTVHGERVSTRSGRPRAVPAHFTPQQRAFVETVRDSSNHVVLRATAGSGKTTTLTEAAWHLELQRPVIYFAYNKHSVVDVGSRLPPKVQASTLHAYGRRVLCRERDMQVEIDPDKSLKLALALHDPERPDRRSVRLYARVWDAAREHGQTEHAHDDDLSALALATEWPEEHGLGSLRRVLRDMRELSLGHWNAGGHPDFTDFLWLPVELNLAGGSLGVALVDEAQDLTPLRQQLVVHLLGLREDQHLIPKGRLIAVGDPEQSIYTYAGADPAGLWRLAERLGAREMPLSVSFRCPASHVALARNASSFIESASGARAGHIEHVAADDVVYQPGDVILSRLNAPLVRTALLLMTRQTSVNIRGRDLAVRLESAAQEAFSAPFTKTDVQDLVQAVYDRRAAPLSRKAGEGDRSAKKALTELRDLCSCLRLLAWRAVSQAGGTATFSHVSAVLRGLYREDADVLLSTIHRAKGLEFGRVTLLYPELMPSPYGDPEEERCVLFVGLTRAKDTLRLAYGKESWANGWRLVPPEQEKAVEREETNAQEAVKSFPVVAPVSPQPVQAGPSISEAAAALRLKRDQAEQARLGLAPARLEDDRFLSLFSGHDVLPVVVVQERLRALQDEPRLALREWVQGSLTLLRTTTSRDVCLHLSALTQVERAARQAKLAVPLMKAITVREAAVLVFDGVIARIKAAKIVRRGQRVWSVTLDGVAYRLDARTGEVLGAEFTPMGLHVHRHGTQTRA